MRKALWLRAAVCAALWVGTCACVIGASTLARADNRSDVVNPGNAKHLGSPEPAPDQPKPKRKPLPSEVAQKQAAADKAAAAAQTAPPVAPAPAAASPAEPAPPTAPAPSLSDAAPGAPPVGAILTDRPRALPSSAPTEKGEPSATPTPDATDAARIALAQLNTAAPPAPTEAAVLAPAAAVDAATSVVEVALRAAAVAAVGASLDGMAPPAVSYDPPQCCDEEPPAGHCGTYEFNGPLSVVSQHPPSVLFYAPMPDVATVLAPGGKTVSTSLQLTNNFIHELDSGTVVDYDFEVLRLTLDYRQRLGHGEFGARIPLDYRAQGFLDPVIEHWHKLFGLPGGPRVGFPEGQYHYTVITRDGLAYNGVGPVLGLGDLALSYKYPLFDRGNGHDALALRAGVKAPTGRSADALGSGNWDYSAGMLWQRQFGQRLRGYANVDYVRTGAIDWPNIKQHNVFHTMWGAEYAWTPRFSLVTQYSTATNALITGSTSADKDPRELTVGFNHRIAPHVVWSGGFREDISPQSAPDFGVLSNFKWQF